MALQPGPDFWERSGGIESSCGKPQQSSTWLQGPEGICSVGGHQRCLGWSSVAERAWAEREISKTPRPTISQTLFLWAFISGQPSDISPGLSGAPSVHWTSPPGCSQTYKCNSLTTKLHLHMNTLQTYFFSTSPTHEGFAVYQLLKPNKRVSSLTPSLINLSHVFICQFLWL